MSVAFVRQAVLSICQKTGTLSVRVPMAGIVPNVKEIKYEMGAIGEGYLNLVGTIKEDGWATEAERPKRRPCDGREGGEGLPSKLY
jgi:hypothetical protein